MGEANPSVEDLKARFLSKNPSSEKKKDPELTPDAKDSPRVE